MMMSKKYGFFEPTRKYRELTILKEVEQNPNTSQRQIARQAIVSSTVVNSYLTEMRKQKFITFNGHNKARREYHITPKGLERKNDLFFLCSREISQFYAAMKQEFKKRLELHAQEGIKKIALFGAAETGELVYIASRETDIQVVGIVDNDPHKVGSVIGNVTVSTPSTLPELFPDAVIITSFGYMDEIYEQIKHLEGKGIKVRRL